MVSRQRHGERHGAWRADDPTRIVAAVASSPARLLRAPHRLRRHLRADLLGQQDRRHRGHSVLRLRLLADARRRPRAVAACRCAPPAPAPELAPYQGLFRDRLLHAGLSLRSPGLYRAQAAGRGDQPGRHAQPDHHLHPGAGARDGSLPLAPDRRHLARARRRSAGGAAGDEPARTRHGRLGAAQPAWSRSATPPVRSRPPASRRPTAIRSPRAAGCSSPRRSWSSPSWRGVGSGGSSPAR